MSIGACVYERFFLRWRVARMRRCDAVTGVQVYTVRYINATSAFHRSVLRSGGIKTRRHFRSFSSSSIPIDLCVLYAVKLAIDSIYTVSPSISPHVPMSCLLSPLPPPPTVPPPPFRRRLPRSSSAGIYLSASISRNQDSPFIFPDARATDIYCRCYVRWK